MTGGPSQVRDLSVTQTELLKQAVREKLRELDSYSDDSLVEYVLVLLANGHNEGKVMADLDDFLSPMVVDDFVQWLFGKCRELKNTSEDKVKEGCGQRIFESALRGLEPARMETSGRQVRRSERTGMVRSSRSPPRESRRSDSRLDERSGRFGSLRRSRSPPRESRRSTSPWSDRKGRHSKRSRSPRVVRYQSINRRLGQGGLERAFPEDVHLLDARQLLSRNRLQGRLGDRDLDESSMVRSQRIVKPQEELQEDESNKLVRCTYWPNCKAGDSCPFAHPSEPCKHFPNCSFGDKCIYIHPAIPCKFQDRCQNPNCNYQHNSPAGLAVRPPFINSNNPYQPPSAIPCRFFPNCKNSSCPFLHPNTSACKFGGDCQRPACPFMHPVNRVLACKSFVNAPCRYGKNCAKPDCPFQHATTGDSTSPMPVDTNIGMEVMAAPESTTNIA